MSARKCSDASRKANQGTDKGIGCRCESSLFPSCPLSFSSPLFPLSTSLFLSATNKSEDADKNATTPKAREATSSRSFRAAVLEEHNGMPEWDDVMHKVNYFAYAQETCPTTGKKHFRGFAYSKSKMWLTTWQQLFPTAHIEKMLGSFEGDERYKSNKGQLVEFGERPSQGECTDLIGLKRLLDKQNAPPELAENDAHFGVVAKHGGRAAKHYRFAES